MRFSLAIILTCIGLAAAPQVGVADETCASDVDAAKSLLITDLSVIDSAAAKRSGSLSLKSVLTGVFPRGTDVGAATETWFSEWAESEALGIAVTPRSHGLLLGLWPRLPSGALDMDNPPLRLLAITYRPDLSTLANPNGEARFIFGAFNPHDGSPIDFTVIFEFALPVLDHPAAWAEDFAALSRTPFGASYLAQLEALTQRFLTTTPSSIAQVRTNDFYLGPEWELREFHMSPEGELKAALTAQTPDLSFDRQGAGESNDLVDWILANADTISQEKHEIPARFLTVGSLAFDDHFKWFAGNPQIPENVRHGLAVNTCNGCHSGETGTRFLHVGPRREGSEPELSSYLKAQMPKRLQIMRSLICGERP